MARLVDLASVIRSKNAGLYRITCDVMFADFETYERVRDAGVITPELIAHLYQITLDDVICVVPHDHGRGIKVTMKRQRVSGNPSDPDILGCQQHAPLYDIEVP